MNHLPIKTQSAYKTIKFIILTNKREESILERMTRKHTYTVKRFLEIIKKESLQTKIKSKLIRLTLTSRNRSIVPYDLKKETKMSYRFLVHCMNCAIWLYMAYKTKQQKWEQLVTKRSEYKLNKIIHEIEINSAGKLMTIKENISEILEDVVKDRVISKIIASKHSYPFESNRYISRKIPVYFDNQILEVKKADNTLKLVLSTFRHSVRMTLNLKTSDYHLQEINNNQVVGGQLFKNIRKRRWEFHAVIKINTSMFMGKKKAIMGIDLGMVTGATVVTLLEHHNLKQKQIQFLKTPKLKRKKFFLIERKQVLQRKLEKASASEKKVLIQELKNVYVKITKNTREQCHTISKMISDIAQKYLDLGYDVHVAIGKLSGIRTRALRGNYKGNKYRGRVHAFPYYQTTEKIKYKCQIKGIDSKKISEVSESWTSKRCHKCDSVNTTRPSQATFKCHDCHCEYNADVNGAINIALRYLKYLYNEDLQKIKMIYLPPNKKSEGLSNPAVTLLNPQGKGSSPPCNESTGADFSAHLKVEDARKVQTLK